jgi:hypothetical protein
MCGRTQQCIDDTARTDWSQVVTWTSLPPSPSVLAGVSYSRGTVASPWKRCRTPQAAEPRAILVLPMRPEAVSFFICPPHVAPRCPLQDPSRRTGPLWLRR